jgi:uncharacterized RDD family membrane protein YckC
MTGHAAPARAGLARRLAATAYDSLLIGALALLLEFLLLPFLGLPVPTPSERLPLLSPGARAVCFAAVFAVCGAYCAWMWSGGRRSLAMRTWHLAITTRAGAPLGKVRALCRYLAWWIGPACAIAAYVLLHAVDSGPWALALLALNYAWALADPDRQFLHDRIAGTRILRI